MSLHSVSVEVAHCSSGTDWGKVQQKRKKKKIFFGVKKSWKIFFTDPFLRGGGALLLSGGSALLPGLCPAGGDDPGGAGGVGDVATGGACHRLVDCPALRSVVSLLVVAVPPVAVPGLGISLGRAQGEWEQANTEQELGERERERLIERSCGVSLTNLHTELRLLTSLTAESLS